MGLKECGILLKKSIFEINQTRELLYRYETIAKGD